MINKERFKEMIINLKEINNSQKSDNLLIKLFPVRKNIFQIRSSVRDILDYIEIDMVSVSNGEDTLDIYQVYFEDYTIEGNTLIVKFKHNKERQLECFS